MKTDSKRLDSTLFKLHMAVKNGRKDETILKLWSKFVRVRDGGKCVECGSNDRVTAHHIVRKCFLPEARFMTGNGATLCRSCHGYVHEVFNRKPDLSLLIDEQNGEKLVVVTALFGILARNAAREEALYSGHYYMSDEVLRKFKDFQGYDPSEAFPGAPIEQAYYIWNCSPLSTRNALLAANGFVERPEPFLPGVTLL